MKREVLGISLILLTVSMVITTIITGISSTYEYEEKIGSYWELADKSSTINDKAKYIDKFVKKLELSGLHGCYDAIIYKTPNSSFDNNLDALKTLQSRLKEIEKMDVSSFEYQTAIQQITEQEQGGASDMLSVFRGTWFKQNHIMLWGWVCVLQIFICFVFLISGIVILLD